MINLLPPQQKQAIKFGRINLILVQYIAVAVITIIALAGIIILGDNKLSNVQNQLRTEVKDGQAEVESLKGYHEEAREIASQIDTLSKLFANEVKFSELLTSIGGVMPTGSSLTQLSLNEDRSLPINLTAQVVNEGTAAVLRKNLEESDIFSKADIVSLTVVEDANARYKYIVTISAIFEEGQGS